MGRAETFLFWLTAQCRGSYGLLIRTISSYFGEQLGPDVPSGARRAVQQLQHLGYISVDWSTSQWEIKKPRMHLLPGGMALALLRGGRSATTLGDLEDKGLFPKGISASGTEDGPEHLPQTILVEFDDFDEIASSCNLLGISFELSYIERLASSLPRIGNFLTAAGPSDLGAPVQKFDPASYQYRDVSYVRGDGLYRQQGLGRTRYWIRMNDIWYHTNRPEGQWFVAAGAVPGLLAWASESDSAAGRLQVPSALIFPAQHVELLSACSGVLPENATGRKSIFQNIPRTAFEAIRSSLTSNSIETYSIRQEKSDVI